MVEGIVIRHMRQFVAHCGTQHISFRDVAICHHKDNLSVRYDTFSTLFMVLGSKRDSGSDRIGADQVPVGQLHTKEKDNASETGQRQGSACVQRPEQSRPVAQHICLQEVSRETAFLGISRCVGWRASFRALHPSAGTVGDRQLDRFSNRTQQTPSAHAERDIQDRIIYSLTRTALSPSSSLDNQNI